LPLVNYESDNPLPHQTKFHLSQLTVEFVILFLILLPI